METITVLAVIAMATKLGGALGSVVGLVKGITWFNSKKTTTIKKEGVARAAFEHEAEKL